MANKKTIDKVKDKLSQRENCPRGIAAFGEVLSFLTYLTMWYQSAHWLAKGEEFYSDHDLFNRLYGDAQGEMDQVAERGIGKSGEGCVERQKVMASMLIKEQEVKRMMAGGMGFPEVSIVLEKQFIGLIESKIGLLSTGSKTLFEDLLSRHEEHLYLLARRTTNSAVK